MNELERAELDFIVLQGDVTRSLIAGDYNTGTEQLRKAVKLWNKMALLRREEGQGLQ